jgi:hypothetical protein
MRYLRYFVMLSCVILIPIGGGGAEPHRALVLSAARDRAGGGPSTLSVVEIESERLVSRAEVGTMADLALSPTGDSVAVSSLYHVASVAQPRARLEVFDTGDLSVVSRDFLPVRRNTYGRLPSSPRMQFSPDGKVVLFQRMDSYLNEESPVRRTVDDVVLFQVRLDAEDVEVFQMVHEPLRVPRARSVTFLRIADWPQITVWNHHLGALEVLDLDDNSILTRVPIGDDPVLATFDPQHLERPNIGELSRRLGFRGDVVSVDGAHAYYIPLHSAQLTTRRPVGHLRKIDLTASPPAVVLVSEKPMPHLQARVATVSETAGALFVAERKFAPETWDVLPSRRVKVFHTLTLEPAAEIELSLSDITCLSASHDGKYLYAVDRAGGMSVVDIATGRELKVLRDVGNHPALVLALP